MAFLRGVDLMAPSPINSSIPMIVFIAYQMMFAIITPALITGAFANRVTFKAYFLFLTAWLIFVYFPFVHMIWGGGFLAKWGVLDFAGGVCFLAVMLKNKLKWDDALDVWGVHGVGGALGIVLLGLFADATFNPAVGTNGLFFGNAAFFGKQVAAIVLSSVWAFAFTYG